MKRELDATLRRTLSPGIYHKAITTWRARLYWQESIASIFIKRTPDVLGYPSDQAELPNQLREVNVLAPTQMCRTMHRTGSDKSLHWHNYTTIYNALLAKLRNMPLRILEIGLGSNDTSLTSNMSAYGVPGASLRGWRELFPNAQIFGADIDRKCLFQEDRIRTTYCDQLDVNAIREMWSQPGFQDDMDLIIEDGLHTFEANTIFLKESLGHLRPGGIYTTEDIASNTLPQWQNLLSGDLPAQFPNHEFALVRLPNPRNPNDNNMLIVRKLVT